MNSVAATAEMPLLNASSIEGNCTSFETIERMEGLREPIAPYRAYQKWLTAYLTTCLAPKVMRVMTMSTVPSRAATWTGASHSRE